jgi:hypothetical protein
MLAACLQLTLGGIGRAELRAAPASIPGHPHVVLSSLLLLLLLLLLLQSRKHT